MSKMFQDRRYWLIGLACLILIISGLRLYKYYEYDSLIEELNVELESDIIWGDVEAPKNIILYFDYNCGYCKKFFEQVYPQLEQDFIISGKARLTLRLICSGNDEKALLANQTTICINKYGDFSKLHKLLLHRSDIIYSTQFEDLIEGYINANEFVGECILNSQHNDVIRNIFQFQLLKPKGTPTFVIGNEIIIGLKDYEFFKNKLK